MVRLRLLLHAEQSKGQPAAWKAGTGGGCGADGEGGGALAPRRAPFPWLRRASRAALAADGRCSEARLLCSRRTAVLGSDDRIRATNEQS